MEAISRRLLVTTTMQAPWITIQDSGWWITNDKTTLIDTMAEPMSLPDLSRIKMGNISTKIVAKYNPRTIVKEIIEVYEITHKRSLETFKFI